MERSNVSFIIPSNGLIVLTITVICNKRGSHEAS